MKNNNKKLQLTSIAAALALSCAANSAMADGYVEGVASDLWAGPYIGASFGGGAGTVDAAVNILNNQSNLTTIASGAITTNTTTTTPFSASLHGTVTGAVADLFVGYNYHKNDTRYLLGAQLEGNIFNTTSMTTTGVVSTVSTQNNISAPPHKTYTTTSVVQSNRTTLNSLLSIIGRAGFLAKPNTLVYGLVGPTEGNFVIADYSTVSSGTTTTATDKSLWKLGLTAGAGLEHKFNENWSVIAEYRHMQINNVKASSNTRAPGLINTNFDRSSTTTTNNLTSSASINVGMNIGKIGIVYRI